MNFKKLRVIFGPLSVGLAAISLLLIVYVKWRFVFESGNEAATLVLVSLIAALVAFVLALISMPRLLAIGTFVMVIIVLYTIFFTSLYALS
jgi:hypothetical protein